MWPWEHLAVGYLAYSAWCRWRSGDPPSSPAAVVALVIGTQFADLVDKPLGWGLGVLPAGTSLGHSVLFAVPLTVLVAALARQGGRPAVGPAFGIGYLLHLPADALYGAVIYQTAVDPGQFLWPLVAAPEPDRIGLITNVAYYLDKYVAVLSTPAGQAYILAEALLLIGAFAVWLADGSPGVELVPMPARTRPE